MEDKSEILPIKFYGKNYFLQKLYFQNFVEENELWELVDVPIAMPNESKETRTGTEKEIKCNIFVYFSFCSSFYFSYRSIYLDLN